MTDTSNTVRSDTADNEARYVLGIECSNPSALEGGAGEVGIGRLVNGHVDGVDQKIEFLGLRALSSEARGSDGLMLAIDQLCSSVKVIPSQIDRIAVSVGPGGYTALRVSVTVAKVLGMSIGCGVVAVPSAAVAAVKLVEQDAEVDAVIALASKNGQSHCTRLIGGRLEVLGVMDTDGVLGCGSRVLVGDSFLPKRMIEACEGAGIELRGLELSAKSCLDASLGYAVVGPEHLGPMYAREPDAVTQWRALHG